MIDMIEALIISRQISDNLVGKKIAVAQMASKREGSMRDEYLLHVNPDEFKLRVEKSILTAAYSKYRHICIETDSGYGLDITDIYGKVLYIENGAKIPGNPPVSLKFDDGSTFIILPGVWGSMGLVPNQQLRDFRDSSDPDILDILSDAFTVSAMKNLIGNEEFKECNIKQLLSRHAKPAIMSLMGAYSQEVLYKAGIHPKKRVDELSDSDIEKLCVSIKDVADNAVKLGGRASERDLFNNPGGFIPSLSSDTVGKPCTVCGEIIKPMNMGGAGKFYICPGCQTI